MVRRSPASLIMVAMAAGYVANGVSLLVTARTLGATGRGAYTAVLVWSMTSASISDLSLGPALARALTVGHPLGHLRRFLPRALVLTSVAALALMVAFQSTFLRHRVPDSLGFAITLSIAPALIFSTWGVYFFQGLASQGRYALARGLPPVVSMVLILIAATRHLTLDGALAALAISYWSVGMWSAFYAWRHLGSSSQIVPVSTQSLVSYGIRAHFGTLASIANARLDVLLLTLVVPLAALGNYALAVSLTMPIAMVGASLAGAYFRRIGADRSANLAVIRSVWHRFFLPTLGLVCLPAAGAFFIPVVFGHEFTSAVVPTLILAAGSCGMGAIYLATNVLQARGLPGVSSVLSTAAAVLSAVTLLLLVPSFGILGAALSSAVTYIVIGAIGIPLTLERFIVVHQPEPVASGAAE